MKLRYCVVIGILLLVFSIRQSGWSQSKDLEKAEHYYELGQASMDKQQLDQAIDYFQKAVKYNPDAIDARFEIAACYFLKKDYRKALNLAEPLLKHKDADDFVYQLVGNTQNMLGNYKAAAMMYEEGLKKFPNSGALYLELGTLEYNTARYQHALAFYEKGILVEPNFASNYYRSALLYNRSNKSIWTLHYGEMYMNLEYSRRNKEISGVLYDFFNESFIRNAKGQLEIFLCSSTLPKALIEDFKNGKRTMGYCAQTEILLYEILEKSENQHIKKDSASRITIPEIHKLRLELVNLIEQYQVQELMKSPLHQFHLTLIQKGYFEAYNYWLFQTGDDLSFRKYLASNKAHYNAFHDWFEQNSIDILQSKNYHRIHYQP